MRSTVRAAAALALAALAVLPASRAAAQLPIVQSPVPGGGVLRASQLWQDPHGDDDLDGDAVLWDDFVLARPTSIGHVEWWGTGASELGFQLEIWRQDPNTIAFQPLGVFYYGHHGAGEPPVRPEAMLRRPLDAITTTVGGDGMTHYVLDLATPLTLAANDATNPRWFIGIVGLTAQPYAQWQWAQGTGGHGGTFQFVRGGYDGGDMFRRFGNDHALVLGTPGTDPGPGPGPGTTVPEPGTLPLLLVGALGAAARAARHRRG